MNNAFLDRGQLVGYDFDTKRLIVTLSDQMAEKMSADGWDIQSNEEIGSFVTIQLVEE